MKKILSMLWLTCGLAFMPFAQATDEAPAEQKAAVGEGKDRKPVEEGNKNGEKKGEGGAEPECN